MSDCPITPSLHVTGRYSLQVIFGVISSDCPMSLTGAFAVTSIN